MTVAAEFFVAGGTVPPGSPSYVERSADRELYAALLSGEYCYVLNSRQMGKSSLAVRTVSKLNEAGVRTAFVDLTKIGGSGVTEEQWYVGVMAEVGRSLSLRKEVVNHLRENASLSPSQRLITFLQEVVAQKGAPVVVFIDEVDAVRSLSFSTDAFFSGVRQCWNARSSDPALACLTFCLMGAALPGDLIRDVRVTPFNVGRRIELRDFSREEARPFTEALGSSGGAVLARVLHWTGGHPFLTQSLCAALASVGASTSRQVDELVRERYLDARARDSDSNLADVGNRLLGRGDPEIDEARLADILSAYERVLRGQGVADDEANPSAARIKMSGISRTHGGQLLSRNRIYAEVFGLAWVRENMPGAEVRRQRRAYRLGVVRASAVAGTAVLVVGSLAAVALKSARDARIAQAKSLKAEAVATRLAAAEAAAKEDALASAENAKRSLARANLAEGKARTAANQERRAKLAAQSSERRALRSEEQAQAARRRAEQAATLERLASRRAEHSAAAERVASGKAKESALLAKKNETEARELLYASNMALAGQMLEHGNGIQMEEYLGLKGKTPGEVRNAGWEQRHFYAIVHESRVLRSQGERIVKLAFTPQGRLLSRDLSMRISLWDPDSGELLKQFQPPDTPSGISSDISRSGNQICLSLGNGDIEVRSPDTFAVTKTIKGLGTPVELVEMPDVPETMFGFFGMGNRLVDLKTGRISRALGYAEGAQYWQGTMPQMVTGRRFIWPNNSELTMLQLDDQDRMHVLWSIQGRSNTVRMTASSLNGDRIAFADSFGYAQVVDARTGKWIGPPLVNGAVVTAMSFTADGSEVATATGDGVIKLWRTADGTLIKTLRTPFGGLNNISLSRNGERVAYGTEEGRVGVFYRDAFSKPAASFKAVPQRLSGLAVSADGETMAASPLTGGTLYLYDAHTGARTEVVQSEVDWTSPAFSPDGKWLAWGGVTHEVRLRDLKTKAVRKIDLKKDFDVASIAFSPDSRRLLVFGGRLNVSQAGGVRRLGVYDVATGQPLCPPVEGTGFCSSAAFSPDGGRVAAAWEGGRIAVFNSSNLKQSVDVTREASGELAGTIGSPLTVTFTPDGRQFLVGRTSGLVEVFDAATAKRVHVWSAHTGRVNGLTFTDGSHTLLTASDDHLVRMWTLGKWRNVGQVMYPNSVFSLAFSSKDSAAYIGDEAGNLYSLRTRYPAPPKPIDPPTVALVSWESILADAKRSRRPIFFPVFGSFSAYDRALRSMLMTADTNAILRKHFLVFDPWQGSSIGFRGKPTVIESVYEALFGKEPETPSVKVFSPDGKLVFNGSIEHAGKLTPLRMPQDSVSIEYFLRVLQANAPEMTTGEVDRLRQFMISSGKPYLETAAEIEQYEAFNKRFQAEKASLPPSDALGLIEQLLNLRPARTDFYFERAKYLARLERWQEAERALAWAGGEINPSAWYSSFYQRAACLALAGDMESLRPMLRSIETQDFSNNDDVVALFLCLGYSMIPDVYPDMKATVTSIGRRYHAELQAPGAWGTRLMYGILQCRAGDLDAAEHTVRGALDEAPKSSTASMLRIGLALVQANRGNREAALAELAASEAGLGGPTPDSVLIADSVTRPDGPINVAWTSVYAVLRREIRKAVGEK